MNKHNTPPKNSRSSIRKNLDAMTIKPEPFKILWRPNNYRRQTEYKWLKKDLHRKPTPLSFISCGTLSSKGILTVRDYHGTTIQVGKNKIQGIYSQRLIDGQKEVWLIARPTMPELDEAIKEKAEEIRKQIDHAISMFSREFNLKLLNTPDWTRYEDWIKGDEFIDNLPEHLIIHDTYFKKVYKGGIEFVKSGNGEPPVTSVRNYIQNRAVEQIAPEIAESLDNLRLGLSKIRPLESLKALIWGLQALETPTPQMIALSKAMTESERLEFSAWLIEEFEGESF